MKNNVIISSIVASILVAWVVGLSASANDTNTWEINKVFQKWWFEKWICNFFERWHEFKKGKGWFMKGLTDEEKTSIKSMTDEEKKSFFETKKAERDAEREAKKAERQAHNNVIDKLLAWETLISEEETLRTEIIKQRAERKADMEAREAERAEMKTIMEKVKSWEKLTDEEQTKIDEMKQKKGWERWDRDGWMRDHRDHRDHWMRDDK